MATEESLEPTRPIEHGTTKTGRWLRERRTRIVLWIAVLEGILVALTHDPKKSRGLGVGWRRAEHPLSDSGWAARSLEGERRL